MQEEGNSGGSNLNVPWAVPIGPTLEEETAAEDGREQAAPAAETNSGSEPAANGAAGPAKTTPDPNAADNAGAEVRCDEAIVRALMDLLIMPDGKIQPQERAYAADLLQLVIEHANAKSKTLLCERLANMPDAPAALIARFLNDAEFEIAKPLLLRATCVSESELISIVENGDAERTRLIAQREHLTPVVTTALAKSGNEDVELDMVRNKDAQISQEALEHLTCRALVNPKLTNLLVQRPEMTAACALYLFWSMSPKQRSYALSRFLADVQVLRQILVMSEPGADLIKSALNGSAGHTQANGAEQGDKPSQHEVADLVAAVAEADFAEAVRSLSLHAEIVNETSVRIVEDRGGEPLTIACKALGVTRVAFSDLIEKWKFEQKLEADTEQLKILFDTLSFRQARMALTYWDWQVRRVGPYTDFPRESQGESIANLPWAEHRTCPR